MDYKYLLVASYVVGIDTCFIIHHIYNNMDCIQVTRHWYEMSDESSSQLHLYLYPHALLICGNWIHCPWMESTLLELEMIVIMLLLPVFCCVLIPSFLSLWYILPVGGPLWCCVGVVGRDSLLRTGLYILLAFLFDMVRFSTVICVRIGFCCGIGLCWWYVEIFKAQKVH